MIKENYKKKKEAIEKLKQLDHCFLLPETANKIASAFGCKATTRQVQDTRSQLKGLTLNGDYKEGDWAEGVDADILAMQICKQLELNYKSYFGRGSQLWECIEVLEKKALK